MAKVPLPGSRHPPAAPPPASVGVIGGSPYWPGVPGTPPSMPPATASDLGFFRGKPPKAHRDPARAHAFGWMSAGTGFVFGMLGSALAFKGNWWAVGGLAAGARLAAGLMGREMAQSFGIGIGLGATVGAFAQVYSRLPSWEDVLGWHDQYLKPMTRSVMQPIPAVVDYIVEEPSRFWYHSAFPGGL